MMAKKTEMKPRWRLDSGVSYRSGDGAWTRHWLVSPTGTVIADFDRNANTAELVVGLLNEYEFGKQKKPASKKAKAKARQA